MITMVHLFSFYGCGAKVICPGIAHSLEIADAGLPKFQGEIRVRIKSGREFDTVATHKIPEFDRQKIRWPGGTGPVAFFMIHECVEKSLFLEGSDIPAIVCTDGADTGSDGFDHGCGEKERLIASGPDLLLECCVPTGAEVHIIVQKE